MGTHVAQSTTSDVLPGGIERLWGMGDVMHYLGFGYTKTWRLIHQYGLPCYQLGEETSPLRFQPDEVRAWVIQHKNDLKVRSAANN